MTLCHSVFSCRWPDVLSVHVSDVAMRSFAICIPEGSAFISGSAPRWPTRMTLFTEPAMGVPPAIEIEWRARISEGLRRLPARIDAMILLLQRVTRAAVRVGGETVGEIGRGLLVFGCVEPGDGPDAMDEAARKTVELRVFEDEKGKMNLDVTQSGGAVLAVSQFTLGADLSRGRRPGFEGAARPEEARPLFDRYLTALRASGVPVATGSFGAAMEVELVNDGPATFLWRTKRRDVG
jgi:D-tyrosyl-tRNA(Tyr) deacylase